MENLVNEDTISLPRWSDPRSISLDISPLPEIVQSQLLSFSLVSDGDRFSLSTSLNLTWEEVEESEELESYEVWVGSRTLGEFEQLDNDESGEIFKFPVITYCRLCSSYRFYVLYWFKRMCHCLRGFVFVC